MGFPGGSVVNNPPANTGDAGDWFDPWVGMIPWRRKWQPTPVFSPRKSHGQRGLVGYSPWGRKESDTAERARTHTLAPKAKPIFSLLNTVLPSGFTPVVRSVNKKPMQPQLSED